jgi:hypothetical protein
MLVSLMGNTLWSFNIAKWYCYTWFTYYFDGDFPVRKLLVYPRVVSIQAAAWWSSPIDHRIDAWTPPSSDVCDWNQLNIPSSAIKCRKGSSVTLQKKSMNKHEQTDNQLNVVRECLGNWWYLHQMVVLSLDANNIPRFSSSDNLRSPTTSRTSPYLLTLHWSHTDVVLLGGWVNPQRCHQTWRAAKKSSSRMQVFTRKSIINEGFNGDIIYKWWIR